MNFISAGNAEIIALNSNGDPILDLDPIDVARGIDGFADPMEIDLVDFASAVDDYPGAARLVWSDSRQDVRAVCPSCDDVFYVYNGLSIIMADGDTRVCTDCEDVDDDA